MSEDIGKFFKEAAGWVTNPVGKGFETLGKVFGDSDVGKYGKQIYDHFDKDTYTQNWQTPTLGATQPNETPEAAAERRMKSFTLGQPLRSAQFGETLGNRKSVLEQDLSFKPQADALDRQHISAQFKDRIKTMQGLGLTPQEIMGSGAGSTGQSGATLGNGDMADRQAQINAQNANIDKQIKADLAKAKLASDTQIATATIASGASKYSADTQFAGTDLASNRAYQSAINSSRISSLPAHRQASVAEFLGQIQLELAPLQKAIQANQVITTAPDFVKFTKAMTMGAGNMLATGIYNRYKSQGIDLFSIEDLSKLSKEEMIQIQTEMAGLDSQVFTEFAGAKQVYTATPQEQKVVVDHIKKRVNVVKKLFTDTKDKYEQYKADRHQDQINRNNKAIEDSKRKAADRQKRRETNRRQKHISP